MKKKLSILLALALCLALAACGGGSDATDPPEETGSTEAALTDGYFTYAYNVEGMGEMVRYMHFYEDNGLGGICAYVSSGGGGGTQCSVGFYTVEDAPFDYSCWSTREERNSEGTGRTEGTAPQTITLTGVNGGEMGSVGYDGGYIYVGDESVSAFVIADALNMCFEHDLEDAHSEAYAAEVGQLLLKVRAEDDTTSFIEIYHNGTYSDMVGMLIEGTYTYAEEGGTETYTLTPDDGSEPASISIAADGSVTYTAGDGSETAMVIDAEKAVFLTLTGKTTQTEYNMEADYVMNLYEDGSCELVVDLAGNQATVDTGTYATDSSYDIVFTMSTLGELKADGDFADPSNPSYTLTVPAVEAYSLSEATLTYGAAARTVSFAFTGKVTQTAYSLEGDYTLNAYDDGSCELIVDLAGNQATVDTGTYALNAEYNFDFTMDSLGTLTTTADFSDPSNPVYSLVIPAVDTLTLAEATIGYGNSAA